MGFLEYVFAGTVLLVLIIGGFAWVVIKFLGYFESDETSRASRKNFGFGTKQFDNSREGKEEK